MLSADLKGVEIAFWEGEIWAQSDVPLFTHAEGAAFDTTSVFVSYHLSVRDDRYNLAADGRTILEGSLRDYSAHSVGVYSTPNFIFLGDDTSSASASIALKSIQHLDYARTVNGDMNGNGQLEPADAVLALQVPAGIHSEALAADYAESGADPDGDGVLGLAECLFIMRKIAGLP